MKIEVTQEAEKRHRYILRKRKTIIGSVVVDDGLIGNLQIAPAYRVKNNETYG